MTPRPRARAAMSPDAFELLFDDNRRERFRLLADVPELMLLPTLHDVAEEQLAEVEVLITSWGASRLDAELLGRMPRLRAVFHAAGSVRSLVSDAFWARDIRLTSAADANSIPVAEFALAAILFAGKRALFSGKSTTSPEREWDDRLRAHRLGNLDRTIGIVGFSRVGRRTVELLRRFDGFEILVADPYADAAAVSAAGATVVSLDELLPQVDVLSLHAPELPATRHLIAAAQLAALRDGATVLNTARGSLLDHDALLRECRSGRLDAVLDVTDPEPLPDSSELLTLPNVFITPHLAGSLGREARRLTDAALSELEAFVAGGDPRHPVRPHDLVVGA
ncbi:hydroxyacid dehydrogenase [Rugosimonospora africana]|uniref:Hydroxyacid dehydrogenase n=1 Tax=Rugosimonospora africana TaxID=556532 RepID=A0A8J3R3D7_9ACTN|nr:hydroxyacid dehydrogenase [Rugosimonospora africana]GIH19371.1 hydroxyacid dehydrogenase [Rugosimonospora africana]